MPLQDKTAEKMLNNVSDFLAATLAEPDQRAWDRVLIYCPLEALKQRLQKLGMRFDAPSQP